MPGDQNDSANGDNDTTTESNMPEEATNGNDEEKFLDYENFSKFYQVLF